MLLQCQNGKLSQKYLNLFIQYFAPLAAVFALCHLGQASTSFAYLDLGYLSHCSWQILSSSIILDEKHLGHLGHHPQVCAHLLLGCKSGLWQSETHQCWLSSVPQVMVLRLRSFSSLKSRGLWSRFPSRTSLLLTAKQRGCTWTKFRVPQG